MTAIFFGACATKLPPGTIRQEFASTGITEILLRGCNADAASIREKGQDTPIVIKGMPMGGAAKSQTLDTMWRGSSAMQWGLDFTSRRHGTTLVISTANEISYAQHRYVIENIELDVPRSVKVVSETRSLSDNGSPNLSPP